MIRPIRKTKLYEDVASSITDMIRSGEWGLGERIPTESALADRFEVGRSTVREAVKSLQITGVLHSKAGMGTFVSESAVRLIQSSELMALLEDDGELSSIVETRYILEPQMAALAAARRTEDDCCQLEGILAVMEQCETKAQLLEQGYQFHSLLAQITRNRILTGFYESIAGKLLCIRDLDFLTLEVYRKGIGDHRAIAQAIREKDGERAKTLMQKHLKQDYRRYL